MIRYHILIDPIYPYSERWPTNVASYTTLGHGVLRYYHSGGTWPNVA